MKIRALDKMLEEKKSEYSFKEEQKEFHRKLKIKLCEMLEPVVQKLCDNIRSVETITYGAGKNEVERMFVEGEINRPMYDILIKSMDNLEGEYIVRLNQENYFETKIN